MVIKMASKFTDNFNLDLYQDNEPANLKDQYNDAMQKIDSNMLSINDNAKNAKQKADETNALAIQNKQDINNVNIKIDNIENEIKINYPLIIISASNSSENAIKRANYKCDGINDEIEINQAIEQAKNTGESIYLAKGDYNIDSFNGNTAIKLPTDQCNITILGCGLPTRLANSPLYQLQGSVLHVTDKAYEEITDNVIPSVLGIPDRKIYPGCTMDIYGIGIDFPNNTKHAIAFNAYGATSYSFKKCSASVRQPNTIATPESVPNFIGFLTSAIANYGVNAILDQCVTFLMRSGFVIQGEHAVLNQCLARHCNFSYSFNTFSSQQGWHSCSLNDCAQELCINNLYVNQTDNDYIRPTIHIRNMTGEISTQGNWAWKHLGRVDDWSPKTSTLLQIYATFSWASTDSGKPTLSFSLFDSDQSTEIIHQTLTTYPNTVLFNTGTTQLLQEWTLFTDTNKKRLPLPPKGQSIYIIRNDINQTIDKYKLYKGVSQTVQGTVNGKQIAVRCIVDESTGEPLFAEDKEAIYANNPLQHPYAESNPHHTPII